MNKKHLLPCLLLSSLATLPLALTSSAARAEVGVSAAINLFFPNGAVRVNLGDDLFHFSEGRFFREGRRGYYLVDAPIGILVPYLPRGYREYRDDRYGAYYGYGDVYYRRVNNGYVVIDQPILMRTIILPGRHPYQREYRYEDDRHNRNGYERYEERRYVDERYYAPSRNYSQDERRYQRDEQRYYEESRSKHKGEGHSRGNDHDEGKRSNRDENGNLILRSTSYR